MPPEAVNMRPSVCFGHRMFLRKQCGPQGEAPYRCGREWVGGARVLPSVGSQGCWRRQAPAQSEAALTAVNKHQTWAGGINHRTSFLSLWRPQVPTKLPALWGSGRAHFGAPRWLLLSVCYSREDSPFVSRLPVLRDQAPPMLSVTPSKAQLQVQAPGCWSFNM